MGEFQNFKFEDTIPGLCPETQLKFRKFLQAAGIENMLINDGRRISDTEVLNEIRKEVAMLTRSEEERTSSLIPACIKGDDEAVRALLPSGEYDVNEVAPDGETALTCAVSANALRIVEMLLKRGADPNFCGKKVECTPLMEAASVGYTDIVKLLLEYGACVDQKSSTGNTALHYASTAGHLECVCLLVQYKSPLELQNETGHTPLMEATSNGHVDVARCLIKHGADINTHSTEFKESALTLASYKGHAEMVRFLLEAGADHEHRTDEMHTALMEAAMEGHTEVARLLLAHGANVNIPQDSFESPLTLAACGGHTELAHLLIGYGADIEEVNDEGYTPLMEAAREGHEETVALLLAVGADVNAKTEETQETALTLAACGGFIEVCEMLLNAGADIEVGGGGCSTPLMEAAQEGHLELVRRLLQRGAAVNAVTTTGDTALHYAAENGHVKVCKQLLDWGAVFGAMTEGGRTPLMKAARNGNLEVVQLFLEHGAPIDQPTSQNDANALSLACTGGHAKVVKYLLQHGADPQYQLRDGSTMLIEAARSGNPSVLRLILDYPKCLTQPPTTIPPPTVQLLNTNSQQQQQLQILQQQQQQHLYQSLVNGSQSPMINPSVMPPPPPPPPLPLSVSCSVPEETCLDLAHAHQHTLSCHSQHQPISFHQAAPPNLVASVNSSQPATHLDAALVSAYAVGWADGAASLVQQQHVLSPNHSTSALLTHPESLMLPSTNVTFDVNALPQSLPLKTLCATATQALNTETKVVPLDSQPASSSNLPVTNAIQTQVMAMSSQIKTTDAGTPSSSSAESISGGSSTSSGGSTSSLVAGVPVDSADDPGAGLLQALFQELMPDKDELIRRFEAAMCSRNPLHVTRTGVGELSPTSTTSVTITTDVAALALSRLVDQQQQCCHRTAVTESSGETKIIGQSVRCSHIHEAESLPCYSQLNSDAAMLTAGGINMVSTRSDECAEPVPVGCFVSNATPILSSCHSSSSSALSTPECSVSSSLCATNSLYPTSELVSTALGRPQYEYELNKPTDVFASVVESTYLTGVPEAIDLKNAHSLFHERAINHDMLPPYRHYHHSGPHSSCALDPAAAVAAATGLGHATVHHHHNPITVPPMGDSRMTAGGLLHLPHQSSAISVDTLINNATGNLSYDPVSCALTSHANGFHSTSSLPMSGARVLPMGGPTPAILASSTNSPVPSTHLLSTGDLSTAAVGNLHSNTNEPITSVNNLPPLVDVNACIESSMETALTLASNGGHVELVRLLLERGADREHRDKKSHTPLHTAVYANQRAVVALLLDYGADIEAQVDRTKDTALSIACSHGRLEIVEELLNRGANKEHRNISDYTPLSLAASGGYVEVIQLLLRHGAEINSRTGSKLGISPLMLASMNGHTNAVRLLLEHGSDINAHIETNRNTALTLACFQGRHDVVQLLVERKANIEHRAKTGLTPLMEAASGDFVEVGIILLEHGADVNASPVPSSRDTALTIAADKGNSKFVDLLLEKGAVVEARNKKGATPLWLASNGGHLDVVQSLIRYKADVNSQDNRKVSCLMAAFRKGHVNVVRLLVQSVTQFPSDKDCVRHIKTAVTDKELAKRCQQCREIIVAAKEKQEGEARKNANCLLEQIEQEEEERANREAMQARKRERKRMKRKAKQEKERLGKETSQLVDSSDPANQGDVNADGEDHETREQCSSERNNSTLSEAVRQVRKGSISSLRSDASNQAEGGNESESGEAKNGNSHTRVSKDSSVSHLSHIRSTDSTEGPKLIVNDNDSFTPQESRLPSSSHVDSERSNFVIPSGSTHPSTLNGVTTTEAKREKHRNKKQSQRAAKRAAIENCATTEVDRPSPPSETADAASSNTPVTSYYPITSSIDNEVNWNAFIDSQNTQYGQYLYNGVASSTSAENNTWTVVLPSNSTRAQRAANCSATRTGNHETTDWKTTSSSSGSFKRRISIPVSRHDIGKVIGQGGAVVSALRNMSGIQIDIESARNDEAPERMVYLKGPSDAVQRTYEAIQGLLTGSLAGNDVLIMYAAMKKSTTTANSAVGKSILSALTSKSGGAVTLTTASTTSKSISSTGRGGSTTGKSRKTSKTVTLATTSNGMASTHARSNSTQPAVLVGVGRTSSNTVKVTNGSTSSNSNNNNTVMCGTSTIASAAVSTIMSTRVSTNVTSWSSKVSSNLNTSSKGNFATVAASGLMAHAPRMGSKVTDSAIAKSGGHGLSKYTTVPNLMSSFPTVTPTTAPVSLLSLNVSPFSTTSQMFPDLALSFSSANELPPDSLDESSFPPLNSKVRSTTGSVAEDQDNPLTSTISDSLPLTSTTTTSTDSTAFTLIAANEPSNAVITALDASMPSASVSNVEPPTSPKSTVADASSNDSSLPVFKPLTVSPPAPIGTQASQPPTPVGSGGSYSASCVGSSPATTIQTRSFARAPGSERSAHQRGATNSSAPITISDSYPPSLMSLDVTTSLSRPNAVLSENLLLTPTKRATSPDLRQSEFRSPGIATRFRSSQQTEWLTSDTKPGVQSSASVFPKTPGFSLESTVDLSSNVSMHPSICVSTTTIPTTVSATIKNTFRVPDSAHTNVEPAGWPLQPTGLNPNAVAFQPSSFQQPTSTPSLQPLSNAHTTNVDSSAPLSSGSGLRGDYSELTNLEVLSGAYNVDPTIPTCGIRSAGTLKSGLHPAAGSHLQSGGSIATVPSSSVGIVGSTFSAHSTAVASAIRPKPLLSVTPNVYVEQRNTSQNGFPPSNTTGPQHLQSQSSMLNNAQLRPVFTAQPQTASQQPLIGTSHLPSALSQQGSVSSRLGGGASPHPILNNQTQMPMGPNSYTPPPYGPNFIQQNAPGQSLGSAHSGTYNPHLLNGVGPSVPMLGSGNLMGSSANMHPSTAVQPPPLQPIGAERRRQAGTTLVSTGAPSNMIYSGPTNNGTGLPFGVSNAALGGQSSSLHPQAPSSQQPSAASSNPNGLIMALTMNWMQQQQQQQQQHQTQQQSQAPQQHWLGTTGSSHGAPTSWQAPMWAPTTVGGSFHPAGGSAAPLPSNKLSTNPIPEYNAFNNVNLVPGTIPTGNGSSDNQQQQQSMVAAAMAAVAGMYPWNGSPSTGSNLGNANNSLNSSQNRWVYPLGTGYPGTAPQQQQQAFFDPLSSLKSSASHNSGTSHHAQSVHRPHE